MKPDIAVTPKWRKQTQTEDHYAVAYTVEKFAKYVPT